MSSIRKASVEDAAALAQIAESTFRATFGAVNPADLMNQHCENNFSATIQRRELLNPDTVTLLSEVQDQLVGFSQVCWHEPPPCLSNARFPGEIRRLYVLESCHGQGIAQELMAASIAVISERQSDAAWLGVWEENPRAIAFYKKTGFVEAGKQEFCLGSERQQDIIMAKPVNTEQQSKHHL